ncbi:hypothetical protein LRAMOSA03809 [Lichtheimia ramosa]|uniref:Mitochondrial glyco protein n=1 Tax=Lichtheimia ramosa TaxID=688394 RepID=A0A077WV95_9FUNG|nr:hypothetical protein LRAMOSA03809 [Lichtheimia ramosa]
MASHLLRASLRAIARPATRKVFTATPSLAPRMMTVARPMGARFMSSGTVDSDLAHKLNEELQYEKSTEESSQPEFISEFLAANQFEIEDKQGHDEVALTRNFGNEKIRVLFSIADINNAAPDDFLVENEEGEEAMAPSFPVRASVTIEKEGKGVVTIDTVAQDGEMAIESVMFYGDSKLAGEQSAEADWQRRGLYIGPQFSELDENLQVLFGRYLEERGVNAGLATFLPDYVEYKEQKEYVNWLEKVKGFVSA